MPVHFAPNKKPVTPRAFFIRCANMGPALNHLQFPMKLDTSPIAAIATAPGRGGIGVVRASGKSLAR
jgi:hypothetical protein